MAIPWLNTPACPPHAIPPSAVQYSSRQPAASPTTKQSLRSIGPCASCQLSMQDSSHLALKKSRQATHKPLANSACNSPQPPPKPKVLKPTTVVPATSPASLPEAQVLSQFNVRASTQPMDETSARPIHKPKVSYYWL